MSNFVGIDLGTTNSAISTYDGTETRIWKSPEQNDVTPSAIYVDRRGHKYFGQRAYNAAPRSPGNCAVLFKRFMGTNTPIKLPAAGLTFTPEECSAEILKVLFGYLPEEIRNSDETGTVITVPAAFNQMKKNATMQAAEMAGIGKVALMQEPVAAIMSVMARRDTDGIFLIYDIGGGTLDIAIAESIDSRVNFLSHGGIEMCGGRDFDRLIVDNVVRPWLRENFELPEDFTANSTYKKLISMARWAAERSKIELSSGEESIIKCDEDDIGIQDLNGKEIYFDIPLQRNKFDELITEKVDDSIACARETMEEAGINAHDLECLVWVGGPTNYNNIRHKVAFELGIKGDTLLVNPMTAVAEGASLFAESIDWSTVSHSIKDTRGELSSGSALAVTFKYIARTPSATSKIAVQVDGEIPSGVEFQVDSLDTASTSGRLPLKQGTTVDVTLTKRGKNTFKVIVYDAVGGSIAIEQDEIVITKTTATVDAIPVSHSIAVEVLDKVGGRPIPKYLIKKGDPLPHKGCMELKAGESIEAGSTRSLKFKLWEGEIDDPVRKNRGIGCFQITGSDFDEGAIPVGADLIFNYEILQSGEIKVEVEVPVISGVFGSEGQNFYSRQDGEPDSSKDIKSIVEEAIRVRDRIDNIKERVDDDRLEAARKKLGFATSLAADESDPETVQEANEGILAAQQLLGKITKENRSAIRQIDLDNTIAFFDVYIRQHARVSEKTAFDALAETAQRSIDNDDGDFAHHLDELRGRNFEILWRQDWFVIERFKQMTSRPHVFADKSRFEELARRGRQLMEGFPKDLVESTMEPVISPPEFEEFRAIVGQMMSIPRIAGGAEHDEMVDMVANVLTKNDL